MTIFSDLLKQVQEIHDKKSHDYTADDNPFGNYHFAGMLSKLFNDPNDAGFVGRIGEKLFRLANLENNNKEAKNESIEDTEIDILTITALWIASRRAARSKVFRSAINPDYKIITDGEIMSLYFPENCCTICGKVLTFGSLRSNSGKRMHHQCVIDAYSLRVCSICGTHYRTLECPCRLPKTKS